MVEKTGVVKDGFFVAGKGTANDEYQIVGNPNNPYTEFETAQDAAKSEVGPPNNFFETTVLVPSVVYRAE